MRSDVLDVLEVLALGMRMATGDKTLFADEMFVRGSIAKVFESKETAMRWLKSLGVEWDGDQKSLAGSVASALKQRLLDEQQHKLAVEGMLEAEKAWRSRWGTGPRLRQ